MRKFKTRLMKMRDLVATPTAPFAGSLGLSNQQKAHGSRRQPSPNALTVATRAIFIDRCDLNGSWGLSQNS